MVYAKTVPRISRLRELADDVGVYPISGLGILQVANHRSYEPEVLDFLKLFSGRITFVSRDDFLQKCNLLGSLLHEEQKSIPEYLRGEQED